jgi:hypothetical protein
VAEVEDVQGKMRTHAMHIDGILVLKDDRRRRRWVCEKAIGKEAFI